MDANLFMQKIVILAMLSTWVPVCITFFGNACIHRSLESQTIPLATVAINANRLDNDRRQ